MYWVDTVQETGPESQQASEAGEQDSRTLGGLSQSQVDIDIT
jgi:hypothetical protein